MHIALFFILSFLTGAPDQEIPAFSRTIKFESTGIESGLSQSAVNVIFQDSKGYMWFGTRDGVDKYDGYTFKNFGQYSEGGIRLAGNITNDIIETGGDTIWVANQGGLTKIDCASRVSKTYFNDPLDNRTLPGNDCRVLLHVPDENRLWIGTDNGLCHLDLETERITRISLREGIPEGCYVRELAWIHDSLWVFSARQGIFILRKDAAVFQLYEHPGLAGKTVFKVAEDGQFLYFGCRYNQIVRLNKRTSVHQEFRVESQPGSSIAGFSQDGIGRLWVASSDGTLAIFDKATGSLRLLRETFRGIDSSRSIPLKCIYTDSGGIVWIGSNGYGLFSYSPYRNKFTLYGNSGDAAIRLVGNYVYSVLPDKEFVWIGTTEAGLERFDRKSGNSTRVPLPSSRGDKRFGSSTLFSDPSGNIWFLPDFNTAFCVDRATMRFRQYPLNQLITAVCFLKSGEIVTGGGSSKLIIYKSAGELFDHDEAEVTMSPLGGITSICESEPGEVWIGTSTGLVIWNRMEMGFRVIRHAPGKKGSLPNNSIKKIIRLKNGNMALATMGGLAIYDQELDAFNVINRLDGLPNDVIYSVEETEEGQLWVSTNKGLASYDQETGRINTYSLKDGLQSDEFNTLASGISRDGELFFGGVNGLNSFFPDQLVSNKVPPAIDITAVRVMGRDVMAECDQQGRDTITTDYSNNFFSFDFAALDFSNPRRNSYRYRLRGIDDSFRELGTKHTLSLELPPGQYLLEVAGSNSDGIWSINNRQMNIVVTPPFWQTMPFITGVSILVLAMAATGIYLNARRNAMEEARLKREIHMTTRELEEANKELASFNYMVSHDLQSPLMNLSHYAQLARENLEPGVSKENSELFTKMHQVIQKMRRLVRDLLHLSRSGSVELSTRPVNVYMICLEIIGQLREEFPRASIAFTGEKDLTLSADRDLLTIALQNVLNNAVKFAPDSSAIVINMVQSERDTIRIEDNGRTIPRDHRASIFKPFNRGEMESGIDGSGIGLAIVKRVIERHGGRVWIEESRLGGTAIVFTIPQST